MNTNNKYHVRIFGLCKINSNVYNQNIVKLLQVKSFFRRFIDTSTCDLVGFTYLRILKFQYICLFNGKLYEDTVKSNV